MLPTLYQGSGGFAVHSYGLLVLVAFTAGTLLVLARAARTGLPLDRLPLAALVAALGGFTAAKVFTAATSGDWVGLLDPTTGFTYYAGILGGGLAVIASARPLGLPVWKLADATAPALALGAGIGRLGCLAAGCCHGVEVPASNPGTPLLPPGAVGGNFWSHAHFPWLSTSFDGGVATIHGVPLYPTQLWQSAGSFALAGLLLAVSHRRRFDGQVAGLWLVLDPVLRTFVEAFRGDARGYAVAWQGEAPATLPGQAAADATGLVGFTTSQGIGLGLLVVGVVILVARRRAGVAPETPLDAWRDDLADEGDP